MHVSAELIDFAWELAEAARGETLTRWSQSCDVENKGNDHFDPVTEADRQAERAMRALIHERYPDHGVSGEEWPDRPGTAAYSWSLDPVDGTRSFICHLPTWVTLIALLRDGRACLGLVDAPCLGETYLGAGDEAWMIRNGDRSRISTSGCTSISDARLSSTDPAMFDGPPAQAFDRLRRDARTVRYGLDGYAYARLAAGTIDLVIESGLKPYDYDALVPLVSAARGTIGDWRGGQDLGRGKIIAAATATLYEEVVARFDRFA